MGLLYRIALTLTCKLQEVQFFDEEGNSTSIQSGQGAMAGSDENLGHIKEGDTMNFPPPQSVFGYMLGHKEADNRVGVLEACGFYVKEYCSWLPGLLELEKSESRAGKFQQEQHKQWSPTNVKFGERKKMCTVLAHILKRHGGDLPQKKQFQKKA